MDKQLTDKRVLEAIKQAEKTIDILWVSHHANRCDAALEGLRAAMEIIQAEQQGVLAQTAALAGGAVASLPAGYVLVPIEPTEAMLDTMHDKVRILCKPAFGSADIQNDREVWAAMLAAAPQVGTPCANEGRTNEQAAVEVGVGQPSAVTDDDYALWAKFLTLREMEIEDVPLPDLIAEIRNALGVSVQRDTASSAPHIAGVGVRVAGELVAWFKHADQAEQWASENYFGQWLMHPRAIPNTPDFTQVQIDEARKRGAELFNALNKEGN